jgi:hypothetical protein
MSSLIRVAIALALMIAAGFVHGAWTGRWGPAPALVAVAERFKELPLTTGAWTATERELPPRELQMLGAVGCLSRDYHHSTRGLKLSVLLLTGLPGDISTHTPEACYPGSGYILEAPEIRTYRYGPSGVPAEFRTAVASKAGATPSILRIDWSWRDSKGWSAPEEPRWSFGTEPMLAKLYVVREAADGTIDPEGDPCGEFLSQLLADLDRVVFSSEAGPAVGPSTPTAAR